jgi:chemotaxis response regulator CheB
MISVVLADDQALVRAGFRALLDAQEDIDVVGEAADGRDAIELAAKLKPDVILMDIRMPVLDGLSATREIARDKTLDAVRIVILTTFEVDEYVFDAIRAGGSSVPGQGHEASRPDRGRSGRRRRRRAPLAVRHPPAVDRIRGPSQGAACVHRARRAHRPRA